MLTIVDYNSGNLRSVKRACDALGVASRLSQDPDEVRKADRLIFPGVGQAVQAMQTLREGGLDEALREAFGRGVPILGICIGTQVIFDHSEEGDTPCLGLIPGDVRRFQPADAGLKIPHIGWNEVVVDQPHPVLEGIEPGDAFYFVHSYFPVPSDPGQAFASSEHGERFCCAAGRENLFATQFHPEKSGKFGLRLLRRFADWSGEPC